MEGDPRNQMTSIPGLYAVGECDYQYHGANRLGANSLLSCLTGGQLTGPGVVNYVRHLPKSVDDLPVNVFSSVSGDGARSSMKRWRNLPAARTRTGCMKNWATS